MQLERLVSMAMCARNSKVECLPSKQNVEIAKFSERFVSMPVLSGRAACNSQYAGALPATGFATEPTNVGVGGCFAGGRLVS